MLFIRVVIGTSQLKVQFQLRGNFGNITVCVNCWWLELDNAILTEPYSKPRNLPESVQCPTSRAHAVLARAPICMSLNMPEVDSGDW
jgi:hypothetical protein